MKTVFKYSDYRKYLRDYYSEMKETTRYFSYRYFSGKAGIKSPVFLKLLIDGERNLSSDSLEKVVQAIGFNAKEATFFKNLVKFNQAKTADEKQQYYAVMLSMSEYVKEHQLDEKQYRYFQNWYLSALREIITLKDFNNDWDALAASVSPAIKAKEAKEGVALLCELGLVEKSETGYIQKEAAITGGSDIMNLARREFNTLMIKQAAEANRNISPMERNVSGITMGISKSCYDMVVAELQHFKERIKTIVANDSDSSRVYQMNFQLFPLSKELGEGGEE